MPLFFHILIFNEWCRKVEYVGVCCALFSPHFLCCIYVKGYGKFFEYHNTRKVSFMCVYTKHKRKEWNYPGCWREVVYERRTIYFNLVMSAVLYRRFHTLIFFSSVRYLHILLWWHFQPIQVFIKLPFLVLITSFHKLFIACPLLAPRMLQ